MSTNGKGSKQRPRQVGASQYNNNWDKVFSTNSMDRATRYWYKRVWTPAQKRKILAEVVEARLQDKKLGTRGRVAAICAKYRITTAHLTAWKKQYDQAVYTANQAWFTPADSDNGE
jgi:hypothetical protein